MVRRPPSEGHKQLLRELNAERAAALQRISSTLESLIRQLQASRERLRQAAGADREREMAVWRDLRARAVKYRWYPSSAQHNSHFHCHCASVNGVAVILVQDQ